MAIDESSQERRRHPRVAVTQPARIWVDEESIVGRTIDMSAYGLFWLVHGAAVIANRRRARHSMNMWVGKSPLPGFGFRLSAVTRSPIECPSPLRRGEKVPV